VTGAAASWGPIDGVLTRSRGGGGGDDLSDTDTLQHEMNSYRRNVDAEIMLPEVTSKVTRLLKEVDAKGELYVNPFLSGSGSIYSSDTKGAPSAHDGGQSSNPQSDLNLKMELDSLRDEVRGKVNHVIDSVAELLYQVHAVRYKAACGAP